MAKIQKLKFFSSFASLNLTQFFSAFNDNLYKLILVFFLINLEGQKHSNTILSVAGIVFVIPFLLFASIAGTLADRYSKRRIIYFTRFMEIFAMSLAVFVFVFHWVIGGYVVLFIMAAQSAFFSPCKYGIIPEIVEKDRIFRCNGIITACTYIAIITGTFFASFFTNITHKNFVLGGVICVLVAITGTLLSLGIEKTYPQAEKKKISLQFITEIFRILRRAHSKRYLLTTVVFGAYFLFAGGYTQLNIIPFALQSLHLTEVDGGYLFLTSAMGIGAGAFLVGKICGKEVELGFVPLATLGITLCFLGLYFFSTHLFAVISLLIILGLFGGFFTVPVNTFIQVASPDINRGQNVAAANFLSFLGVIFASLLLALLGNGLGLMAAQGFLIMGFLTLIVTICLFFIYADPLFRLFASTLTKLFCRIQVIDKQNMYKTTPMLLVAPYVSWLDTVIMAATLPRLIHSIVLPPDAKDDLMVVKKELKQGNSICLMCPAEVNLDFFLQEVEVPILTVHIFRKTPSEGVGFWAQLKSLTQDIIEIKIR